MSVFKVVKKELVSHIANLSELFLILKSIIICSVKFFLYDLLDTGFSSIKTEYIYGKQFNWIHTLCFIDLMLILLILGKYYQSN